MEMCRSCLSTHPDIVQFDEKFTSNYSLLTNLQVTLADGMPEFACRACIEAVKFFMDFREKAIASDFTLKKIIFEKGKAKRGEVVSESEVKDIDKSEIKLEIKKESADDPGFPNQKYSYKYQELIYKINKDKELELNQSIRLLDEDNRVSQTEGQHDNNSDMVCGLCSKTFDNINSLKKHVDSHEADKKCMICKDVFTLRQQTLAHRIIHIPQKQKRCHICQKYYISPINLEYHYSKVHFDEAPKLMCKHCDKVYDTPKKLNAHIWTMHTKEFYCDICSKSFSNKSHLKIHIASHSDKKNYVCDMCAFSCKHLSGLKDHHARKHTLEKVTCKKCYRIFVDQMKFDNHKCTGATCICPVCGKDVQNKRLNRHIRSHSDVCSYTCPRCPAKFKTACGLKVHIDRHDGNKTYQCEFCQRRFYTASVLIKHRRIHTGEKPYVCRVCNKGFTGNNNLKLHMRVHGEYLIVKKDKLSESENSLDVVLNISKK